MATYGYPYPQPAVPGYFNANYMPQTQQFQPPQMQTQPNNNGLALMQVPDELTALNAQFPMDGSPAFFINANGEEIYSKQLSMANGSVIFRRYRRDAQDKGNAPAYVTHAEMDKKLDEIYQLLGAATAPTTAEGSDKK